VLSSTSIAKNSVFLLCNDIGASSASGNAQVRPFRAAGADRAAKQVRLLNRKILDVAGLGLDVGFGDVDLHVESVGDAASQRLLGVPRAATPFSQG